MTNLPEYCICGAKLVEATGIGLYCPNPGCLIADGPFDGSESPYKLKYPPPTYSNREIELIDLIIDLTDELPCKLDDHGQCPVHRWYQKDPSCPHGRAKDLLNKAS